MSSHTAKTAALAAFSLWSSWALALEPCHRGVPAIDVVQGNFAQAPGYIDPDAETLHSDGKLQEQRWHNLHAASRPLCCASGPPHGGRLRLRCTTASVVLGIAVGAIGAALADPSLVLPSGLPVQVKPTFQEPGLPAFSFPVGGSSSVGGSSVGEGGSGSGGSSSGSGSVSTGGSGDAYSMMMSQDWGSEAEAAASAMGVSATALAATCAMESNCQNVGATSSVSNPSGAFQM